MLRTSLVFGSVAGLIVIIGIMAGLGLFGGTTHVSSYWFGYLVMILALSR